MDAMSFIISFCTETPKSLPSSIFGIIRDIHVFSCERKKDVFMISYFCENFEVKTNEAKRSYEGTMGHEVGSSPKKY